MLSDNTDVLEKLYTSNVQDKMFSKHRLRRKSNRNFNKKKVDSTNQGDKEKINWFNK